MGLKRGKLGVPTGTVVLSYRARRRINARRRAEEREWAQRSGPVRIHRITPSGAGVDAHRGG